MTKQELVDAYIERIDNEIGLADGSGVGFDRDGLFQILMDLVNTVEEQARLCSVNIERNNHKVPGHDGYGRYDFIGRVNSFRRLTEHQAAEKIGGSILYALRKYCDREGIDMIGGGYGVKLSIEFEKYERK